VIEMNAEEARRLTAQNEKRQKRIQKEIEKGERCIKSAVEQGYRREAHIYPGACDDYGNPDLPEVVQHFKDLGYNVRWCHGTHIYEVRW